MHCTGVVYTGVAETMVKWGGLGGRAGPTSLLLPFNERRIRYRGPLRLNMLWIQKYCSRAQEHLQPNKKVTGRAPFGNISIVFKKIQAHIVRCASISKRALLHWRGFVVSQISPSIYPFSFLSITLSGQMFIKCIQTEDFPFLFGWLS